MSNRFSERVYSFEDRARMAEGSVHNKNIPEIISKFFPDAINVKRANREEDRNGVDYWVTLSSGRVVGIDVKTREKEMGDNDVALETWSVMEEKIVGWTRNKRKRTDYILCIWFDTGRCALFSFPMLCEIFCQQWEAWSKTYKTVRQRTPWHGKNYHSECVFVPIGVIREAERARFDGKPTVSTWKVPRHRGGLPEGGYIAQLGKEQQMTLWDLQNEKPIYDDPDMNEAERILQERDIEDLRNWVS